MLEEEEGGAHVPFGSAEFPIACFDGFEQVLFAGMPSSVRSPGERCDADTRNKTSALHLLFLLCFAAPGF